MSAEKKRNRGGRPRVRSGDEVQVTVEFPLEDYARLAGYVDYRKALAVEEGTPVSQASKRLLLMLLWREYYNRQPRAVRREVESTPRFLKELKRKKRGRQ